MTISDNAEENVISQEVILVSGLLAHDTFEVVPNKAATKGDNELFEVLGALCIGLKGGNVLTILNAMGRPAFEKYFICRATNGEYELDKEALWALAKNQTLMVEAHRNRIIQLAGIQG